MHLLLKPIKNVRPSSELEHCDPSNKHSIHSQSNQIQHQLPPRQAFNYTLLEQKETIEGGNDNYDFDTDALIELEPEGVMITKPIPSYQPPINQNSVDKICKSMHASIGLFKAKNKRIQVFRNMILNTTKSDRVAIRIRYRQKYKVSINRLIIKYVYNSYLCIFFAFFLSMTN